MNKKQKMAVEFGLERAANQQEDKIHELVIRTRVPSKWRFIDLETGQVWKYENGLPVLDESTKIKS